MKFLLLAAAAVLISGPAVAQQPGADTLVLDGATAAPDCGNLYGMAGRAFCVTAPLARIGTLADAYIADLAGRGWLAAGGDENRVVFVRRRDGGGCDGLQMQAFYDTSRPAAPEAPGYLGFAPIPGDVCTTPAPAASSAPNQ